MRAADSLPYKIWKRSGLFVGADDLGGPRATARVAPTVFCGKVGRRVREAAPYNRVPPERAGEGTRPYGALYFVGAGHWPARIRGAPRSSRPTQKSVLSLPPHPPQCAHWGTFPPGGRLRRAATWGRPYGGNIALKNKKTLSSRDWDESVWFASWCHPISERPGRSLWTPCCGGGAAPVSRPAGGAVFGRVRLRGVLSTWGRSPWDLSLSGGIPVTHAPSWR